MVEAEGCECLERKCHATEFPSKSRGASRTGGACAPFGSRASRQRGSPDRARTFQAGDGTRDQRVQVFTRSAPKIRKNPREIAKDSCSLTRVTRTRESVRFCTDGARIFPYRCSTEISGWASGRPCGDPTIRCRRFSQDRKAVACGRLQAGQGPETYRIACSIRRPRTSG
jgi:hypothetical protein